MSPSDSEFRKRPSSVVVQSVVRDLTKNLVLLSIKPCWFRVINYWINSRGNLCVPTSAPANYFAQAIIIGRQRLRLLVVSRLVLFST